MDTRGALVSLFFRMPMFNTREAGQIRAIRAPCAQDVSECAQCWPEGIVIYLAAFLVRFIYFYFSNGERFLLKKKAI